MFGILTKLRNIKKFIQTKEVQNTVINNTGVIQVQLNGIKEEVWNDYQNRIAVLENRVQLVKCFSSDAMSRYVYAPKTRPMDGNQFFEAMMTLLSRNYDYVLVSNGLDNYPLIDQACLEDALIASEYIYENGLYKCACSHALCGKLVRLPGYYNEEKSFQCEIPNTVLQYESFLVSNEKEIPAYNGLTNFVQRKKEKKLVFVMPIFMAVGGVERNTVEIMRALQDRYEFVVITMERHNKTQGSLNYQLNGLCECNIDLREVVEFDNYFDAFEVLKNVYQPDVIWLCNNSPWLEANMLKFRDIFADQRIVAQDVYDTVYGWIEYYNTEGMQSVDKYIAVNEKIKATFMDKYAIPEEKIFVVYSAIDDAKIRKAIATEWNKEELFKKYGLDSNKKHVALIGRMTEQKNPIRYLSVIKSVTKDYPEIEFLLVGDGVLGEQVDAYIAENGIANSVKRIKFVDSTPELFQILDGLVLTSVYEGLAIVSIEAMCIGVPIWSTDTGDLKLFLDKTEGGIIIDETEDDVTSFKKWYTQNDIFKENALKHGKEILDFFSAYTIAKQYDELFS